MPVVAPSEEKHRASARSDRTRTSRQEFPVLDVIYIALTIGIFGLVALVAKGVEKL